jgi:hypothetical protein
MDESNVSDLSQSLFDDAELAFLLDESFNTNIPSKKRKADNNNITDIPELSDWLPDSPISSTSTTDDFFATPIYPSSSSSSGSNTSTTETSSFFEDDITDESSRDDERRLSMRYINNNNNNNDTTQSIIADLTKQRKIESDLSLLETSTSRSIRQKRDELTRKKKILEELEREVNLINERTVTLKELRDAESNTDMSLEDITKLDQNAYTTIKKKRAELSRKRKTLETLEKEMSETGRDILVIEEKRTADLGAELTKLRQIIEDMEADMAGLKAKRKSLTTMRSHYKNTLSGIHGLDIQRVAALTVDDVEYMITFTEVDPNGIVSQLDQANGIATSINETLKSIDANKDILRRAKDEMTTLEGMIKTLKDTLLYSNEKVDILTEKLEDDTKKVESLQKKITKKAEKIKSMNKKIESMEGEIRKQKEKLISLRTEVNSRDSETTALMRNTTRKNNQMEHELESLTRQYNIRKAELESARTKLSQTTRELDALRVSERVNKVSINIATSSVRTISINPSQHFRALKSFDVSDRILAMQDQGFGFRPRVLGNSRDLLFTLNEELRRYRNGNAGELEMACYNECASTQDYILQSAYTGLLEKNTDLNILNAEDVVTEISIVAVIIVIDAYVASLLAHARNFSANDFISSCYITRTSTVSSIRSIYALDTNDTIKIPLESDRTEVINALDKMNRGLRYMADCLESFLGFGPSARGIRQHTVCTFNRYMANTLINMKISAPTQYAIASSQAPHILESVIHGGASLFDTLQKNITEDIQPLIGSSNTQRLVISVLCVCTIGVIFDEVNGTNNNNNNNNNTSDTIKHTIIKIINTLDYYFYSNNASAPSVMVDIFEMSAFYAVQLFETKMDILVTSRTGKAPQKNAIVEQAKRHLVEIVYSIHHDIERSRFINLTDQQYTKARSCLEHVRIAVMNA